MTLPNTLTLVRIALIPVFVLTYIVFADDMLWISAVLFASAALTDWLDGYLARRLKQRTAFGAFLDPVADKLIVVTALVLLIESHSNLVMTLPGLIIVGREIIISALREWMAEMNRRGLVDVIWLGKIKTAVQMIAIVVLIANPPSLAIPWVIVGMLLLYVAALMTLWSMFLYLKAAWPTLREGIYEQETQAPTSEDEDSAG
ncbi:MAG: CDP-diacylglycerol--glycerol-3-phosphate 3-phosphatidyltransferase [Pseudomonadales bacterium]